MTRKRIEQIRKELKALGFKMTYTGAEERVEIEVGFTTDLDIEGRKRVLYLYLNNLGVEYDITVYHNGYMRYGFWTA